MSQTLNFKKLSFLVYGLGYTGQSVINYLKGKKVKNLYTWDDNKKFRKSNYTKTLSIKEIFKKVDYIVLSPGVSFKKALYKTELKKFERKIITDIDLLYLNNFAFKSVVVTGTNGKSTTCKLIYHLLKKNGYNVKIGGNIGTPVLDLKIQKNIFFIIEASSFQLSHSKYIKPNYAILLNITNDHLDWHGSMKEYIKSKLKIFKLQDNKDYALINKKLIKVFNKNKYFSKLIPANLNSYKKLKTSIKNEYLQSQLNDENMSFVFSLAKLFKISNSKFKKSMKSFAGLPTDTKFF